ETIARISEYVNGLGAGKPVIAADLLKSLEKVKDLSQDDGKKPRIAGVTVQVSDLSGVNRDAEVEAFFQVIKAASAGPDEALKAATDRALFEAPPQVSADGRRADRSLIQSTARPGQQATDAEIETAEFKVVTPSPDFTIVLDLEPTDIVLQQP